MFSWEVRGIALTNIQAIIFLVTVCCLALLQFIVYRTRMGKAMRAVSHDHVTAGLMGVNVDLVISFTFGLGAALAGIGGVLYGIAYPQVNTFMGVMPGLKAFTAAVLGGIGSIPAVLGALIMGRRKPDRGIPLLDITGRYRHHPGAVLLLRPGILSVPGTEKGLNAWKISDRQGSSVPGRGGGGRAAAGIVRACQSILGPDVQLGCIMSISALGLNVITGLPVCSPWGTRHSGIGATPRHISEILRRESHIAFPAALLAGRACSATVACLVDSPCCAHLGYLGITTMGFGSSWSSSTTPTRSSPAGVQRG